VDAAAGTGPIRDNRELAAYGHALSL
jgi:hypothetical protein